MMYLSLRSPGPWVDRSSERERSTENTGLTGFYQTWMQKSSSQANLSWWKCCQVTAAAVHPLTFRNRFSAPWSCPLYRHKASPPHTANLINKQDFSHWSFDPFGSRGNIAGSKNNPLVHSSCGGAAAARLRVSDTGEVCWGRERGKKGLCVRNSEALICVISPLHSLGNSDHTTALIPSEDWF